MITENLVPEGAPRESTGFWDLSIMVQPKAVRDMESTGVCRANGYMKDKVYDECFALTEIRELRDTTHHQKHKGLASCRLKPELSLSIMMK